MALSRPEGLPSWDWGSHLAPALPTGEGSRALLALGGTGGRRDWAEPKTPISHSAPKPGNPHSEGLWPPDTPTFEPWLPSCMRKQAMCSASGTLPTVSVCTCHLDRASPKGAVPSALDSAPSCHMKGPTANAPPSLAQAAQARRSPPPRPPGCPHCWPCRCC